jgi:hypothetical protein
MASARDLSLKLLISARDTASGVLGALTGRVAQLGAAISAYLGGRAIAQFFASAVSGAADLEQQLTVLQQVSGATAEDMARLKAAADAVADSPLPFTAGQAAGAQIELAKAGQSAGQILASLPAVLNLAAAGELELADAAATVTRTLAGFGLGAENATRAANVLVAGANASSTSVRGIAEALSYMAPAASAAGYSLEQSVTYIGALANRGIDASRAGTVLNSVISQLVDPASAASKALDSMGVTSRNLTTVIGALSGGGLPAQRASAGISLALTATQYGMALAIPAVLWAWLLSRRVEMLVEHRELVVRKAQEA